MLGVHLDLSSEMININSLYSGTGNKLGATRAKKLPKGSKFSPK